MVEIMENDISDNKICSRCHRVLRDAQSRKLGFGPVCYKKHLQKQKVYLFELAYNNTRREENGRN